MTEVKTHSEHIELVKKQAKECHFRKHVATHKVIANSGGVRIEHLLWKTPGDSNCHIDYYLIGNRLIITGDLGEAIHYWYGSGINFNFLSGLNLEYFHEKCQASELGRAGSNYEWDTSVAAHGLDEHFKAWENDLEYAGPEYEEDEIDFRTRISKVRKAFEESDGYGCLGSAHQWVSWLNENADDVFRYSDWAEEFYGIGEVIPARCILHLEGIKMAWAQLEAVDA